MLARLVAFSSNAFTIEAYGAGGFFLTETLTRPSIDLVAGATSDGPLYDLCRAIRDAKEGGYDALVGKNLGAH